VLSALGVGAFALLALIATPVVLAFQSQSDDVRESERELATYRAEVAAGPAVVARLKDTLAGMSTAPGLLRSASVPLAQSELENAFKSMAARNGAEIRSTQILPATKKSGFDVIAVEYDLTVPESRLRDLAYSVEAGAPYLFIDDVTITAPGNVPTADVASDDPALELRWTVRGYRWSGP
jgi:Type II secretion system (T2SS), protein M subtype b